MFPYKEKSLSSVTTLQEAKERLVIAKKIREHGILSRLQYFHLSSSSDGCIISQGLPCVRDDCIPSERQKCTEQTLLSFLIRYIKYYSVKWFCYQGLRYVLWLYHLLVDTAAFLLENTNLTKKTKNNCYMST